MTNLATLVAIDHALMDARLRYDAARSNHALHARKTKEAHEQLQDEGARIDDLSELVDPAQHCNEPSPTGPDGSVHICNRTTTHDGFHAQTAGPHIIATWVTP